MEQLLALNCEQAGELWGSVWGERLWHWLRGEDFDMSETEHLKSISHSHVLSPEMRTSEKAWAVAHKLLHKAAMRLRVRRTLGRQHRPRRSVSLSRADKKRRSAVSASPPADGTARLRLSECQDNQTLIAALEPPLGQPPLRRRVRPALLHRRPSQRPGSRPAALAQFFRRASITRASRTRLLATMDELNHKYGTTALAPAAMLTAYKAAPTRIAFHTIPDLF